MVQLMEWISLLFPVLAIAISIASALISNRQYRLSKRAQLLRPHSDRLNNVFKSWLQSNAFLPEIRDTANIPEYSAEVAINSQPSPPSASRLRFAVQHLETGYPKIYSELKEIESQIDDHNMRTDEFVDQLYERIRKELKLQEPPAEKRYAYYRRLISYSLSKILTGYPEREPEMVQTKQRCELRWNGTGLVIGDRMDCEKSLKLIHDLRETEEIVKKARDLHELAKRLKIKREKLREKLHLKITDNIEVGGIIRGQCEACS
jgi:hypothetical protein